MEVQIENDKALLNAKEGIYFLITSFAQSLKRRILSRPVLCSEIYSYFSGFRALGDRRRRRQTGDGDFHRALCLLQRRKWRQPRFYSALQECNSIEC